MQNNNPWKQNDDVNDGILELWDDTPIQDTPSGAIPSGKYPAKLIDGALGKARTGTAFFWISWELLEGEYAGRRLVSRHYLTPPAIGRTKSELVPLGIHGDHLRGASPLPLARALLSVVQRADETGDLYNDVKRVAAMTEHKQENTSTASQDAPQNANGDIPESTSVSTPERPIAPPSTADDDFLDKEF